MQGEKKQRIFTSGFGSRRLSIKQLSEISSNRDNLDMKLIASLARRCAVSLMSAALLFTTGRVKADDDTISVGFNTSVPTAYVTYTTSSAGATTTENVYVGAFINITDSQHSSSLPSSTGFCIDLWHNMSGGQSFQGTVSPATGVASQSGWFPYALYTTPRESDPTFTNQLNYIGAVYNSLKGLTGGAYNDAIGAVQLSIWYLIDSRFAASGVGNDPHGNLLNDFGTGTTGIIGLLNGHNETIEGLNLTGFSSTGNYAAGTLITVDRMVSGQSGQYQNMIMWGGNADVLATPEPSTLAIGGVGALAFLGYALRRRKALGGC
jgi:PEP-CTERM motif